MLFGLLCFMVAALAFKVAEQNHVFGNGFVPDKAEERIAGGEEVETITYAPFIAQIVGYEFADLYHCSGVIISESYIITAGSCLDGDSPDDNLVRVGSVTWGYGDIVPIAEVVLHEKYHANNEFLENHRYDIGYLRTESPLVFDEYIQPCILASDLYWPPKFNVSGWGKRSEGWLVPTKFLRTVELKFLFFCEDYYPRLELYTTKLLRCGESVNETMDQGACTDDHGDRGSPAYVGDKVYGISTYTEGCGPDMKPSIFTNLLESTIRKFIIEGTGVEYEEV